MGHMGHGSQEMTHFHFCSDGSLDLQKFEKFFLGGREGVGTGTEVRLTDSCRLSI